MSKPTAAVVVTLLALGFGQEASAKRGYGETVDAFCLGYDGSTPFADLGGDKTKGGNDGGCLLCHLTTSGSGSQPGTWSWWNSRNYSMFCTGTPPNGAPNGTIVQPNRDIEVVAGSTVRFEGSGSDPDGDAIDFDWDFGSSTAAGAGPHFVAFDNPGSYTVKLNVSDGLLDDPSPAVRLITVTEALDCVDADRDGFAIGDVNCGPLDCNDNDSSVNPSATEICTDGVDNNCDGRIDAADPVAVGCDACIDLDGDRYSPEGGVCGPVDCDDGDQTVNPGASEVCGDSIDNDCDFYLDDTDAECDGTDCIGGLLPETVFAMQLALESDRGPSKPLDGLIVSGPIYVFVPSVPGIRQVRYYVNEELTQTENWAPWDLAGGSAAAANPLQTRNLVNGWYSVVADIDMESGQTHTVDATFMVKNAPNRAPSCAIEAPSGNRVIRKGESLRFAGAGTDPEGDLPLSFKWDFGGGAASSTEKEPGDVRFGSAGVFVVTFTATDSLGLRCDTAATRVITVENDPETIFDAHPISDKYAKEGHENDWERRPDFCKTCHGSDLRGTSKAATFAARVWKSKIKQPDGSEYKRYAKGDIVGCMDCHTREQINDDDDDDDD